MSAKKTFKKKGPRNFLEQLAELSNTAPEDVDPESLGFHEGESTMEPLFEDDSQQVSTAPSSLRRKASTLMNDPIYSGKASSRKKMDMPELGLCRLFAIDCVEESEEYDLDDEEEEDDDSEDSEDGSDESEDMGSDAASRESEDALSDSDGVELYRHVLTN